MYVFSNYSAENNMNKNTRQLHTIYIIKRTFPKLIFNFITTRIFNVKQRTNGKK